MFAKLRTTFFALLVALAAGWGAVNSARAVTGHFLESDRMGEWVVTQAVIQAPLFDGYKREYRYTFGGRDYLGKKLFVGEESRVQFGDYLDEMVDFLDDARQAGKPVSIYVNPDNPAQSVVDRDVRAGYVVLMSFFEIVCASVALPALGVMLCAWFNCGRSLNAKAWRDAAITWLAGLNWSFPAFAISLVLPGLIAEGQWGALLLLLFPLAGALILLAAAMATLRLVRRGPGDNGGSE